MEGFCAAQHCADPDVTCHYLYHPALSPWGSPHARSMHPAAAEARGIGTGCSGPLWCPASIQCQCIPRPCLSAAGSLSETDLKPKRG